MIRSLFLLIFVAVGFAGGFYTGLQYERRAPGTSLELFLHEYGEIFQQTALEKAEKAKEVILDDMPK